MTTALKQPQDFDTAGIITSGSLTADEKKLIAEVIDRLKYLDGLVEKFRPSNSEHHRKAKDTARIAMSENPTPATIAAYQAALGAHLNPQALFEPVSEDVNALADQAAQALDPIALRLHAAALDKVRDAKTFGISRIDSIKDISERGAALIEFAGLHAQAIADMEADGAAIGTPRGSLNWLARYGFVESPYNF